MISICDEKDCLLHPDYFTSKLDIDDMVEVNPNFFVGRNFKNSIVVMNSDDNDNKRFLDNKIIFKFEDFNFPVDCLLCEYCKKIDMKMITMSREAKRLLEKTYE